MKIIHVAAVFILSGLMILGFVANNLWRWMPEFSTLDAVAAFSIHLQVGLLLLAIFTLFMTLRSRRKIRWSLFVLSALASVISWYSVRVSDAENAFTYGIFPFSESRIHFSKVRSVRLNPQSIVIKPVEIVIPAPSKVFGFDKGSVFGALQSHGECLEKGGPSGCVETEFAWP